MARKKVSSRLQQIGGPQSAPPPMPGRSSETQLVELGMFITTTFLGTLILAALALFFGISAIENNLETGATAVIAQQTAAYAEDDPSVSTRTDVAVDATGVDLLVRGTVGDEEQIASFPVALQRLDGVGTVTVDLQYVPPADTGPVVVIPDPITVSWVGNNASIIGEVSDDSTREALIAKLGEVFSGTVTADELTLKEGAPTERDWLSKVLTLIEISGGSLNDGQVFVNASQKLVQITGEYETRQERRDARDAIEDVIGETTFAFVNGLSIPPKPEVTQEQIDELQGDIDELIEGKVVEFELNSDVLTAVGTALLDEIIEALEQFPFVPIEIGGHTDSQGEAAANLDLSERRAQAAFAYLVAKGQDPDRFVVEGYGEDVPVASNSTADGRARNRRIEFKAILEE